MQALSLDALAKDLDSHLNQVAMQSATDAQIDAAEGLLGIWIERIQEERDGRRMEIVLRNGNDGYGETE